MPRTNTGTIAQAAAFALFEELRRASAMPVDPTGAWQLSFERVVDPASAGLAWTYAEDDALQLKLDGASDAIGSAVWLHARCDEQGPLLALYLERDRPIVQVRFSGATFVAGETCLLRERVVFPSHDGRHTEREAMVAELARAWRVPMEGPWLELGRWNPLESAWEPDTARRFVAAALVVWAARQLAPEWLLS